MNPFVKISCGCVGISLNHETDTDTDSEDFLIFQACDTTEVNQDIICFVRSIEKKKGKTPLTQEEFNVFLRDLQKYIIGGSFALELRSTLKALERL
jgi:hypothetical protein